MGVVDKAPQTVPLLRSWFALAVAGFAAVATFIVAYSDASGEIEPSARDTLVCQAAHEWRTKYGATGDLRIVVSDIRFHGRPGEFASGEGAVVAPLALALPGAQEVLEIRASPPPARVFHVEGMTAVSWPYAGTLHRDMRFVGVALVRRAPARQIAIPPSPTFRTLGEPWAIDARTIAAELEDEPHALRTCAAFAPWVKDRAGPPPYTDQILRIVRAVSAAHRDLKADERNEDLCASLRANALTPHLAQVVAVMAARQLGAPAFGLTGADAKHTYLVATYVDDLGWISLDLADAVHGYRIGGPTLLTLAPLATPFEASQHAFWYAGATAFAPGALGVQPVSHTRWVTSPYDAEDFTLTTSVELGEACP